MSNATAIVACLVLVFLFGVNPVAAPFIVGAIYVVGKLVFDGPD